MLKNVRVRVIDYFTSECVYESSDYHRASSFTELQDLHSRLEKEFPNCNVNVSMGNSFIYGQALNMKNDESLLEAGLMKHSTFNEKWGIAID